MNIASYLIEGFTTRNMPLCCRGCDMVVIVAQVVGGAGIGTGPGGTCHT